MNELNVFATVFIGCYGSFGFLIYFLMIIVILNKSQKTWTPFQCLFLLGSLVSIPSYMITVIAQRIPEFTERHNYFGNFFLNHGFLNVPFDNYQEIFKLLYIAQTIFASCQQFLVVLVLINCVAETLGVNMNVELWTRILAGIFGGLVITSVAVTFPLWWCKMHYLHNMIWNCFSLVPAFIDVQPKMIVYRWLMVAIHSICIILIVSNLVRRNIGKNVFKPDLLSVLTPITAGLICIIQLSMENYCSYVTYIPHKLRSDFDYWMFLHTPVVVHLSTLYIPYLCFLADRKMRKDCWNLIRCSKSKRPSSSEAKRQSNNEMTYDIELAEFVPVNSDQ